MQGRRFVYSCRQASGRDIGGPGKRAAKVVAAPVLLGRPV